MPDSHSAAALADTEQRSISARDLSLMLLINLIWGLNLVASKLGVMQLPPVLFTALRFGAVALLLVPWLRRHPGQTRNLLAAAILTGPLTFALLFTGLFLVADASMVAVASQMAVPISTLMSVWLLGETIRWRRRLGIALAFGGIVVIGFDPRAFSYWEGLALVILSCVAASLGMIYVKRLRDIKPLELQAWIGALGGPALLAFSLLVESHQLEAMAAADWRAWGALAYTTLLSTLVAHTGWYYLLARYPVTSLSPLTLLTPLFGILFGVTLLHDQLTTRMMLGGAITLFGVFIVLLREKRLVDTGT